MTRSPFFAAAVNEFQVAEQRLIDASLSELRRLVNQEYPEAQSVCLHGEYNEDGLVRLTLTCIDHVIDPSDELADALDEVLMYLGEHTGEDYLGNHEVTL